MGSSAVTINISTSPATGEALQFDTGAGQVPQPGDMAGFDTGGIADSDAEPSPSSNTDTTVDFDSGGDPAPVEVDQLAGDDMALTAEPEPLSMEEFDFEGGGIEPDPVNQEDIEMGMESTSPNVPEPEDNEETSELVDDAEAAKSKRKKAR